MTGSRARVVLVEDGRVALVKRVREGMTYYLFPGGGVEDGETPEQAAAREALEELGVDVQVGRLLHEEVFGGQRFLYFAAEIAGGAFGTGSFPDGNGIYEPVWLPLAELASVQVGLDVRPRELVQKLLGSTG